MQRECHVNKHLMLLLVISMLNRAACHIHLGYIYNHVSVTDATGFKVDALIVDMI